MWVPEPPFEFEFECPCPVTPPVDGLGGLFEGALEGRPFDGIALCWEDTNLAEGALCLGKLELEMFEWFPITLYKNLNFSQVKRVSTFS